MKKIFSASALLFLPLYSGIASAQQASPLLKDSRDGQTYATVQIGNQIWMAQNLNFKTAKSVCYSESRYGCVYTWADAMALPERCNKESCASQTEDRNHRGICPEGWHVPSYNEWNQLVERLGGDKAAGKHLKSKTEWKNENGTDTYGFNVLPTGGANEYQEMGYGTTFWTASELWEPGDTPAPNAAIYVNIGQYLLYENANNLVVMDDLLYKDNIPAHIRCMKD